MIVFAGIDWWYHNRAHYDVQFARRFATQMPVLFINSIGVRVPSVMEGSMFWTRVTRKLKSVRRGLQSVEDGLYVFSPPHLPSRWLSAVSPRIAGTAVRRAAHELGIRNPLVWVTCPTAAPILKSIQPAGLVYERTDRWEEFPGASGDQIRAIDRTMKATADLTLFAAKALFEAEGPTARRALLLDHGVDFNRFRIAREEARTPSDVVSLPRPRVAFVGGIDEHTFDRPFFDAVAAKLPEVSFYLVGRSSFGSGWPSSKNVHALGQRLYEEVPAYMAAADVLIMPWQQNDWIRGCNPIKLKEYLACGRPVVSTYFPELDEYRGTVSISNEPDGFAAGILESIQQPPLRSRQQLRVANETWDDRAQTLFGELNEILGTSWSLSKSAAPADVSP